MPSMSQVVAGIAFLAVAGSWSWAFLADISVEDPGKPRIKAEPVARLEASLPVIGPFPSFNVNKENPFIPSQFREKERKVNDSRPTGTKPPPPTPVVEKPALPALAAEGSTLPTVLGIQVFQGKITVLTVPPGEATPRWLAIGDVVGAWRLTAAEGGRTTVWTETTSGQTLRLVVSPAQESSDGGTDSKESSGKSSDGSDAKAGKTAQEARSHRRSAQDPQGAAKIRRKNPKQAVETDGAVEDQAQPAKPPAAPAPPKEAKE